MSMYGVLQMVEFGMLIYYKIIKFLMSISNFLDQVELWPGSKAVNQDLANEVSILLSELDTVLSSQNDASRYYKASNRIVQILALISMSNEDSEKCEKEIFEQIYAIYHYIYENNRIISNIEIEEIRVNLDGEYKNGSIDLLFETLEIITLNFTDSDNIDLKSIIDLMVSLERLVQDLEKQDTKNLDEMKRTTLVKSLNTLSIIVSKIHYPDYSLWNRTIEVLSKVSIFGLKNDNEQLEAISLAMTPIERCMAQEALKSSIIKTLRGAAKQLMY